ncbi:MAG: tRNA (guanine(26)-N(2))-dimethyltransferase [Methanobacterium sp. PtaU1.Bin097]|nr:MAG: tRNA (guanine(26)-N(2))-dimethyltransferase [Methanobacterium sp. PtaU1.Bin097]
MNSDRETFYNNGLKNLPKTFLNMYLGLEGENGEVLSYDEAEVWKRILNYRIAKHLKPHTILETHAGKGVSTELYRLALPSTLTAKSHSVKSKIISCRHWEKEIELIPDNSCDLIDIDPFGQPYKTLEAALPKLKDNGVLMVTNGEMMSVVRHLKNTQHLKTDYYGKTAWQWVIERYLPYLEKVTGLTVQFFYAFPTTVRTILSKQELPRKLFKGCKQWMWWLEKYAMNYEDGKEAN